MIDTQCQGIFLAHIATALVDNGQPVGIGIGGEDQVGLEPERVRLGPLAGTPDHIRPRGGDFRSGDRLIEPGLRLDAWRLSLAAAAGFDALFVARRPRPRLGEC